MEGSVWATSIQATGSAITQPCQLCGQPIRLGAESYYAANGGYQHLAVIDAAGRKTQCGEGRP